ncbi:MAG: glycosyltransferase family 2 protein [Bacteroidales bacterium]|nr:glycosyltransferase family 2 protein [Bacteroidales bacterium]
MKGLNIITPVKDSIALSELTIRSILTSELPIPFTYTVYNDNSTPENTSRLHNLSEELGFSLVDVSVHTEHPSPNYLWVLREAQRVSLARDYALLIVESDVKVKPDTLRRLYEEALLRDDCGIAAAVTVDEQGHTNYPYEQARKYPTGAVRVKRHLSFCCSLLKPAFLRSYDFRRLNPKKAWFDVDISRQSSKNGFANYLFTDLTVLHHPHGSRPWKLLKYRHPLKYYWRKFTGGLDKI